jgi:hypothetical protein
MMAARVGMQPLALGKEAIVTWKQKRKRCNFMISKSSSSEANNMATGVPLLSVAFPKLGRHVFPPK